MNFQNPGDNNINMCCRAGPRTPSRKYVGAPLKESMRESSGKFSVNPKAEPKGTQGMPYRDSERFLEETTEANAEVEPLRISKRS